MTHGATQHQFIWNIRQELFAGLLFPEASGLILFILFKGGMLISGCHLGHCKAGILLLLCCLLLGHMGLYTFVGHLGLYMFVAIWACTYLLPFGTLHGRQITIIM